MPDSRPAPPFTPTPNLPGGVSTDGEISTALLVLAARLDAEPDRDERVAISAQLRDLAGRLPVALPHITTSDDTAHWRRLPDERLRSEVYADAWNLAAGLHETRRRALVRDVDARLRAGLAPFGRAS